MAKDDVCFPACVAATDQEGGLNPVRRRRSCPRRRDGITAAATDRCPACAWQGGTGAWEKNVGECRAMKPSREPSHAFRNGRGTCTEGGKRSRPYAGDHVNQPSSSSHWKKTSVTSAGKQATDGATTVCRSVISMLIPSFVDSTYSDPILTKTCLPKMFAPAMLRAVFVREDSAIKHRQGIAVWHSPGLGLNCCDTCGGLSRSKIWSIGQTNFGRGRGKRRRTRQDASGFPWETRTLSVDCPTIYKYPAMASGLPTDGGRPVGEGGVRVDVRPIGISLILSWLSWSRQDARICDCALLFLLDTQIMPA